MARTRNAKHVSIHPDIGSTPFAQYAGLGWSLEIGCYHRACGHLAILRADELVALFGPGGTSHDLDRRARCAACGRGLPAITAIVENAGPAKPR